MGSYLIQKMSIKTCIYKHFKMNKLTAVLTMVGRGSFIASTELTDAYCPVSIASEN